MRLVKRNRRQHNRHRLLILRRKIHTEPEWAWSLTDQAHALGIPVFMKEDLVPIIGDENMIQEMPEEFNKVLEVQRSWQK